MDMPTPCPRCGKVIELDDMVSHPNEFKTLVCEACHDLIEEENNRGFELDSFGNRVEWHAEPKHSLINFKVNDEEITVWGYEDDPELSFFNFMNIWNKAQSVTNKANIKALTAERDHLAARVSELEAIIYPDDKSTYLGFTVSNMLYYLSKDCKCVKLEAVTEAEWLLHVMSEQHGEFEMQGGLMRILGLASKPFFKSWQIERQSARDRMNLILDSVRETKVGE